MTISFDLGAFLLSLTGGVAAFGILTLLIISVVCLKETIETKKHTKSDKPKKQKRRLRFYFDSDGHMRVREHSPVDRAIEELEPKKSC